MTHVLRSCFRVLVANRPLALLAILMLMLALSSTSVVEAQQVGFASDPLNGESLVNPTSLEFGPDDRLYVSQQDGYVYAYEIVRNGPADYQVVTTEQIGLIRTINNHFDDTGVQYALGDSACEANEPNQIWRQVTGLMTAGTASNPMLYVSSSDPCIAVATDSGLDTNSGVLSRLTWVGNGLNDPNGVWDMVHLVRGLARSEENHAVNGMDLDPATNTLYMMVGGHTNKGAPGNNLAGTPEYFTAGALIAIDLDMLDQIVADNNNQPFVDPRDGQKFIYDMPTLNDPDRQDIDNSNPNFPYGVGHPLYNATIDINDPFGGNNGQNQAIIEPNGPVQIYSPGYRNAYDVIFTSQGRLYTVDNGPNTGWGGLPELYDSNDNAINYNSNADYNNKYHPEDGDYCTNEYNESESDFHGDSLHFISGDGYYGGHPAPIRAFPALSGVYIYQKSGGQWQEVGAYNFGDLLQGVSGYFNASLSINDFPNNPVECYYLADDNDNPAILHQISSSTNGIAEYTASNFNGAIQGHILTASFNGSINRYELNAAGNDTVTIETGFLSGFGSQPLDITTQGDLDIFPGTIWAAVYGANSVQVFEPGDFTNCVGSDNDGIDEDNDGYTNADEIDNGTNPCSGGSKPDDFDNVVEFNGFKRSNLLDADDDNDGVNDVNDAFAWDANNGLTTNLPITYPMQNFDPDTGFFGLGFTGLMTNGTTDYLDQFDETNLDAGGAGGVFSVSQVPTGDAYQGNNNQQNGFQFGINVDTNTAPFIIHSALNSPFFNGVAPVNSQQFGVQFGLGDQDNYLKVVFGNTANGAGIEVLLEEGGTASFTKYSFGDIGVNPIADFNNGQVDIYIEINPATLTAQPRISTDAGGTIANVGGPVSLPTSWFNPNDGKGLAVGFISTSIGSGTPFATTWDFLNIEYAPVDAIPPVITLLGANPLQLNQGDNFSDPGYTASDNVDGNLTGNVQVGGDTVDTNTLGTYVVTYDVSDSAGNAATQVTRTVVVNLVDAIPPVITLIGANPLQLNKGDDFSDPGYVASDNIDGIITGNVQVGGDAVDTSTPGTYVITYNVSDSAGNAAAQVTRTVIVNAVVVDCGPLFQEAETADLTGFQIENNPQASGGLYVVNDSEVNFGGPGSTTTKAVFCFNVITSGTYQLGATVFGPTTDNDSFFVDFGGTTNLWDFPAKDTWFTDFVWDRGAPAQTQVYLEAGTHEVIVSQREKSSALDALELFLIDDGNTPPSPAAIVTANNYGGLFASTAAPHSYTITNNSNVNITSVSFDLSTAYLQDIVYDPTGTAGDAAFRCLVIDSGGGTGFVNPGNLCLDPFSAPNNGVDSLEGFDVMTLNFNDFNNGETVTFSVDMDPTSIKGDQSAGDAGSISGLEFIGATVTVTFANGDTIVTSLGPQAPLTQGGAQATAQPGVASPATPALSVQGVQAPGVVSGANQTLLIQGPANATVMLLHTDARLYIDPGGGGYDVDPFEANEVLWAGVYTLTLDNSGNLILPVTLVRTASPNAGPEAGLNHFIAMTTLSNGQYSPASNTIVLEYDPSANQAPVANAGNDQTLLDSDSQPGEEVTLNGSASTDADGDIVSWDWSSNLDGNLGIGETLTTTLSDGVHTVTLTVTDNAGGDATDTVVINVQPPTDTIPPIIALQGDNPLNLTVGDSYADPGYTASDNVDGDITGNVQIGGDSVDSNIPGTYIVTYDVSDNAGNNAQQVTRTVIVSEIVVDCGPLFQEAEDGDLTGFSVVSSPAGGSGQSIVNPNEVNFSGPAGTNTKAVYCFTITQPGTYQLQATAYGPGNDFDSFYVEFGGAESLWDFPISGTWFTNFVTNRGVSGPTQAVLNAGPVEVIISQREKNSHLDNLQLVLVDAGGDNQPPVADAGADITVADSDNNNTQSVSLNASASFDNDGSIVSYTWAASDVSIPDGLTPTATFPVGTTTVTLTVTDNEGATGTDDVLVTVQPFQDNVPPVITLNGANPLNLTIGDSYADPGYAATDNVDGDITENVQVGGEIVDSNTPGTYVVTYDVSDSAGNAATQVTRTVNVNANGVPVITLQGANPLTIEVLTGYSDPGYTASDPEDGDITDNVQIGGDTVDPNTLGTYVVTYDVSDNAGNPAQQVTRTVIVVDTTAPVITLQGANPLNLNVGDSYSDPGYTAADNLDGDVSGGVQLGGDTVDANTPGTYIVTYDVSDNAGNPAQQVTRTVIVGDVVVDCGPLYQEAEDGDLTGFSVVSSPNGGSGQSIVNPNEVNFSGPAGTNTKAIYCFTITQPGTYQLQATAYGPGNDFDSFYVEFGGAESLWDFPISGTWFTDFVTNRGVSGPTQAVLNAGPVEVIISQREKNSYLDNLQLVLIDGGDVNQPPVAIAGTDIVVTDDDNSGTQGVTLDASGSFDSDGVIVSYAWAASGLSIPSVVNPTVEFPQGTTTVTLSVIDDDGASSSDTLTVTVNAPVVSDCGPLSQEAEDGDLTGFSVVSSPNGGSGHSIVNPNEVNFGGPTTTNTKAVYCFTITQPGTYQLLATAYGPGNNFDSFYVEFGGTESLWDFQTSGAWFTNFVTNRGVSGPTQAYLSAGEAEVTISQREKNSYLDNLQLVLVSEGLALTTNMSQPAPLSVRDLGVQNGTLTWTASANAVWYQVWIGTAGDTPQTLYQQWIVSDQLGCQTGGTCTLTPQVTLPAGYTGMLQWYVQGYGPGGLSTGGVDGWAAGPTIDWFSGGPATSEPAAIEPSRQ